MWVRIKDKVINLDKVCFFYKEENCLVINFGGVSTDCNAEFVIHNELRICFENEQEMEDKITILSTLITPIEI